MQEFFVRLLEVLEGIIFPKRIFHPKSNFASSLTIIGIFKHIWIFSNANIRSYHILKIILIRIYSDIRSYCFSNTNIFEYSFVLFFFTNIFERENVTPCFKPHILGKNGGGVTSKGHLAQNTPKTNLGKIQYLKGSCLVPCNTFPRENIQQNQVKVTMQ